MLTATTFRPRSFPWLARSMKLTVYTDYTLRVLMYLSLRHESGALTTIEEIAAA